MKKNTVHQIYRFWLWDSTKRVATAARETKTAVTMGKKTAATVRTAVTTGIAAAVKTVAAMTKAPKVFREGALIAAGEKTATIVAKASKKNGATSFDKREKYIWINSDAAVFA